ncbi:MAG: hypothetical protein ACE5E5_08345 [Phycisphaerae bacterium]
METVSLNYLIGLAAFTGFVHTLLGPDHYIPFIALARSGNWTLRKTLLVTALCGVGHVGGSVILGSLGAALGWGIGGLTALESVRGEVAGWLLLGFGFAYTVWGVRRAIVNRPDGHLHMHHDGTLHRHGNGRDVSHVHTAGAPKPRRFAFRSWTLFIVFVFGPCEVLIPQLMYPAARQSLFGLVLIVAVFGATTIATMTGVVVLGYLGVTRFTLDPLERYVHALSGSALLACGLAIKLGL